jgi:hypothetical protein
MDMRTHLSRADPAARWTGEERRAVESLGRWRCNTAGHPDAEL